MNPTELYRCWVEVSFNALRGNLAWIRGRVGRRAKILAVVKADAYGHGLPQIAGALMQGGVDIFGVATLGEALGVRAVGAGWPILLLGSSLPAEIEATVRHNIMPTISSLDEARRFQREAARQKKSLPVHVKVDTGMGRLGFWHEEAVAPIRRIAAMPNLRLEGIYTHFPSAEDDVAFSLEQVERFRRVLHQLAAPHPSATMRHQPPMRIPLRHAENSAGLLSVREGRPRLGRLFNVVRPGLAYWSCQPTLPSVAGLQPTLSFKSRVILVKRITAGCSISYGRTFVADRPMRVAIVGAGYGDGYSRALSNRAQVLIRGRRCRVLGRVTMDQTIVDVSEPVFRDLLVGEEVVLLGAQGREAITATEVAAWEETIPWEVLTSITKRVPRVYIGATSA
ncbi:MAG: alanine racemase [Verrucomicrobiae bacterium]|nr:alanine racemase [Verrucomicrobiae bacterium]